MWGVSTHTWVYHQNLQALEICPHSDHFLNQLTTLSSRPFQPDPCHLCCQWQQILILKEAITVRVEHMIYLRHSLSQTVYCVHTGNKHKARNTHSGGQQLQEKERRLESTKASSLCCYCGSVIRASAQYFEDPRFELQLDFRLFCGLDRPSECLLHMRSGILPQ